jgi:CDP-paratose synthetase
VKSLTKLPDQFNISILKRSISKIDRLNAVMPQIQIYDFDLFNLESLFKLNQFDVIIHCATDYGRKNSSWLSLVESNILFPMKVLQGAIKGGVKLFINIDTMLPDHTSNYSLSKSHFREWLQVISQEVRVVNIRMEHFYGPGDDDTKFITSITRALLRGDVNIPLTAGLQKRDFVYIEDVLSAIVYVLKKGLMNIMPEWTEYELGSGVTITIKELVEKIKFQSGNQSSTLLFGAVPYRQYEAMEIKPNLSALRELGWSAKYDLATGIDEVINYERG